MTVEQFFARYAALSMADDDRAMAAAYAPSFFVAGPKGSMTFANDARFLDWLAQVRWSARFEKTGDRAIEFEIAYLIELAEESWRVLGYVSARDQEEEMRALSHSPRKPKRVPTTTHVGVSGKSLCLTGVSEAM